MGVSSRKNPAMGYHPDLFEAGETPLHVPLEELSEEEIRDLPRAAFSDEEWEQLDADTQRAIHTNDPESAARIKELKELLERATPSDDPEEYFGGPFAAVESAFESFVESESGAGNLQHVDLNFLHYMLDDYEETYGREAVEDVMNEVLADSNLWEFTWGSDSEFNTFREEIRTVDVFIGHDDIASTIYGLEKFSRPIGKPDTVREQKRREMFDDEIEAAIEEYEDECPVWAEDQFTVEVLRTKFRSRGRRRIDDVIVDMEVEWVVLGEIDYESAREAVRIELEEQYGEVEDIEAAKQKIATPPEERVVYRFPDGFYVQDLVPSELPEEGKQMGMCVGRPDMGYIKAVRTGNANIYSLRRPSGKPLLTIEYDTLDNDIVQIKGKANRYPGWALGKIGQGKLKADEVRKAKEFVEHLGLDPYEVRDLWPGLAALEDLEPKVPRRNPAEEGAHCGFCAPRGAGLGCSPHADEIEYVSMGELGRAYMIAPPHDERRVKRFEAAMRKEGRSAFPPVRLVRRDDGVLFVEDGRHRIAAAMRLGPGKMPAIVTRASPHADVAGMVRVREVVS